MDTKPSTHYHPLPNKLINRASRALNRVGLARIDLSESALIAAARRETGLQDFGDESFLPALRVLLHSLQTEAQLNPMGRLYAKANIVGSLKNRLWAQAAFAAHPEIRQRKIVAPIVIIGPHRSGTTRLQRMMSADSQLMHLSTWEGMNPAPRPGKPEFGKAERWNEAKKATGAIPRMYPGAFNAHPMHPDWAEEEMLLLNHSFCSFSILGAYHVPSYYQWFLQADKTDAYRYTADLMRLIAWQRGEPEDKPWVLKNPQHMMDLGTLLQVFPDARLVFTHRDPQKTVASVMSLMWHYTVQHTDAPCRAKVREIWLDFCQQAARRCMDMREQIPAAQQIDVYYEQINHDWRAVMRRIYEFGGIQFDPQAQQALEGWLQASESENLHGGHKYALEDFGTSKDEVEQRMKFVRDFYAIPFENRRA
ncbi:MAG: sulfotransferase [Chitinivorax sp.]